MVNYKPYPKYKPSGVEWIGDIPEGWEAKKIKRDTPVLRGASPRPIDDPKYFDDEGEYAWVRISDVTNAGMYLERTTEKLSNLGASLSVKLNPGDLFLSIAGSVGKACLTKIKCCIHDGFVYFPQLTANKKFLYYIFESGDAYKGLGKLGTQLNLNTDTVASILIGFPPYYEQQQIGHHLEKRTSEIDVLIKKIESAITKLLEYRSSIITAAVTGKIDVRGNA
jgi:type I restriction enzyme S subunit